MPHRRPFLVAVVLAALLAACGGDPGSVTWRDLTLELPEGWTVFEEADTRLSISNVALGPGEDGEPGEVPEGDAVAMFFTHEPSTAPGDWRTYVEEQDATLESDEAIEIDEVPATRLVFSYETAGIPTREMVVVIPARQIVVLAQPVTAPGETDGPDIFLEYVDTFLEILHTIDWGAPVSDGS